MNKPTKLKCLKKDDNTIQILRTGGEIETLYTVSKEGSQAENFDNGKSLGVYGCSITWDEALELEESHRVKDEQRELFEQKMAELEAFVKSSSIYTSVERGMGYSFKVYENERGKFNTRTNVATVWYYSERGAREKRHINMFSSSGDYYLWREKTEPLRKLLLEFPEFISF